MRSNGIVTVNISRRPKGYAKQQAEAKRRMRKAAAKKKK